MRPDHYAQLTKTMEIIAYGKQHKYTININYFWYSLTKNADIRYQHNIACNPMFLLSQLLPFL